MKNLTMYLPGFSHRLGGRRGLLAAKKALGQSAALDGLAALVGRFVPAGVFATGEEQRDRVFTPWVTFVAFLGQVLTRGSACREAVRRVQAWCVMDKRAVPSESTSAYCQARPVFQRRLCRRHMRHSVSGSNVTPRKRGGGAADR